MIKITRKLHVIDAANRSMGRVASEIAPLLRGKHKVGFSPERDMGDRVRVSNVKHMKFTGSKLDQKKYYRHSGYPGGIKERSLSDRFKNRPDELLRDAVYHMLPKNKLRDQMIKRLRVEV